ncbi:MAG: hypothetical protein KIT58_14820 [Planctomycetota bacterium]|nr:hypothetical protein [Planctomycetota bacterium]
MSDQMNRLKYTQFVRQAKGNDVTEVQVTRQDRRDKVVLQYVGTARKSRQRFNGEWAVPRADRTDEQVKDDIRKFLDQARKDFFVRRGEGLQGDEWHDAAQDVEVKTIQGDDEKQ